MIITAIEAQKKNKNRYSVFIDGSFAFGLHAEALLLSGLKENVEITSGELDKIKADIVFSDAKNKALNYLSYSARSRAEMLNKLKTQGFQEDIIENVLIFLENRGYINDLEYARKLAASKAKAGYGRRFIKSELYFKGIEAETVKDALGETDSDTTETILELLHKKIKSESKEEFDKTEKRKILGFLSRRGFGYDDINSALRTYWEEFQV